MELLAKERGAKVEPWPEFDMIGGGGTGGYAIVYLDSSVTMAAVFRSVLSALFLYNFNRDSVSVLDIVYVLDIVEVRMHSMGEP